MAYTAFPSVTRAASPTATDDSSKGFVVGSQWVDTSVAPRKVYLCTDASLGAAAWVSAGGVTAHTALSSLGWSASGHTGTQNAVACFGPLGATQTVQATVDNTVLTYTGGVLTFSSIASSISVMANQDKTLDVEYIPRNNTVLDYGTDAATGAGSII